MPGPMRITSSFQVLVLGALVVAFGCDEPVPGVDAGDPPLVDAGGGEDAGVFELATTPVIPAVTGTCPDFHAGDTVTMSPAGVAPRDVRVWVGENADTMDGPLVFYWHGAGGSPTEAMQVLGAERMAEIQAAGGMVVGMIHDPAAGDFPWYLTTGTEENDLLVADEVVACAVEQVGIDVTHIHSIGFSAGALHNSQMAIRRASYLASVVVYSGGLIARRRVPTDAPDARFAALLFHGGASDVVLTNFEDATETYRETLERAGHFAVVCDHGRGHTIPPEAGLSSAWRFLMDHPYASYPSPYASGLPEGFYDACVGPG